MKLGGEGAKKTDLKELNIAYVIYKTESRNFYSHVYKYTCKFLQW
jgi:hypothetical protein